MGPSGRAGTFGKDPLFACQSTPIFPPSRVALKERNGEVPESDSPVKRPGRKVARVLGSEGEEEDEALTPSKGQVGPHKPAHHDWKKPSFPAASDAVCRPAARLLMPQVMDELSGRALEQMDGLVCAVLLHLCPMAWGRLRPSVFSCLTCTICPPEAPTVRGDSEQEESTYGSENNA